MGPSCEVLGELLYKVYDYRILQVVEAFGGRYGLGI